MANRAKYRRVTDLYITGREHVLRDGETVIWLQVLNPFEVDEARHDAQSARSRAALTMKGPEGGEGREMLVGQFYTLGTEEVIKELANFKANDELARLASRVQDDPEWKERLDLLARSDEDDSGTSWTPEERETIARINREYIDELKRRQDEVVTDERNFLSGLPSDDLLDRFIDAHVQLRGGEVGRREYEVTELWLAARACEAVRDENGEWNHGACENHRLRAFEDKREVRELPEDLQDDLMTVLRELNMSVREAKNSVRLGSSSDSSPQPSAEEESTSSTSDEIPPDPPGISPQPSPTPAPSSAG